MSSKIEIEDLEPLFGMAAAEQTRPLVIAGPCSAESRGQVTRTASELAGYGLKYFRAGLWKPRTRPGSFEGVGARGLPWLAEVRERLGMVPLTEVANQAHLRASLRAGIDAFWIGARTTANPFAMQELADVFASLPAARVAGITVLVKNPVNPDLELWIGAFQRLYAAGVRRLGAVHRGFSAYGDHLYRNLPEWRIPIELKRRLPNLPVLCDPSHIAGRRDLVARVARQAMGMNFDGLIVETHCSPDEALSDSAQQLTPARLAELTDSIILRMGHSDDGRLAALRDEIDSIDSELVALLGRRMDVSRMIGRFKQQAGMPVVQPARYQALMADRVAEAEKCGLPADFMRRILSTIHEESVRQQLEIPEDQNSNEQ